MKNRPEIRVPPAAAPVPRPALLDRLATLLPSAARAALHTLAARRPSRPAQAGPTILPGLDTKPAAMPPLRPPAATNDNPLQSVHDAVERDLRARGYLG